jgi:hypothetical protein
MDTSRRALRALGLSLIAVAAVLGLAALEHLQTLAAYGRICGGSIPHCPACPASLAALLLGVSVLFVAACAPKRRRIRIDE